jgi:hypothetical protein
MGTRILRGVRSTHTREEVHVDLALRDSTFFGVAALAQAIGRIDERHSIAQAVIVCLRISAVTTEMIIWAPWVYDFPMPTFYHQSLMLWDKVKAAV